MTPWCIVLVCSWRRLLADRHSLPFPWTLSLHRRWCPSASHHPVTFLFLLALSFPLYLPFLSLGLSLHRRPSTYGTRHATQHPPRHEAPRSPRRGGTAHPCPTTDTTRHNPYPCAPCRGQGTQHAQQGQKGEGRGFVLHLPKGGLSARMWRKEVIMCPRRGNDPASGHPRAHQPPLGRGTSPPAWDGRLDALGQRRRQLPSYVWTRHREVKQGKSGGSVGTTDQGNGKGRSGERQWAPRPTGVAGVVRCVWVRGGIHCSGCCGVGQLPWLAAHFLAVARGGGLARGGGGIKAE